jgi:predicted peroxiredoxin
MKKILVLSLMLATVISCIRVDNSVPPEEKPAPKDGAFIHISKGEAHAHDVLMALMLADKFSESHDVLVFFDIDGIEMVTKDAPNLVMDPFDPSDDIFKRLLSRDVTILACPACMKVSGIAEEDLREGIETAQKDMFFDFTEGRILSLDY